MTPSSAYLAGGFAVLGLALGLLQFTLLHRNLAAQLAHSNKSAALSHSSRAALAIFAWASLVHFGAMTGTAAALVGFLVARSVVATRLGRAA